MKFEILFSTTYNILVTVRELFKACALGMETIGTGRMFIYDHIIGSGFPIDPTTGADLFDLNDC